MRRAFRSERALVDRRDDEHCGLCFSILPRHHFLGFRSATPEPSSLQLSSVSVFNALKIVYTRARVKRGRRRSRKVEGKYSYNIGSFSNSQTVNAISITQPATGNSTYELMTLTGAHRLCRGYSEHKNVVSLHADLRAVEIEAEVSRLHVMLSDS